MKGEFHDKPLCESFCVGGGGEMLGVCSRSSCKKFVLAEEAQKAALPCAGLRQYSPHLGWGFRTVLP